MPRLTKIVTRTGDLGETSLGSGKRVRKDHLRIQAVGSVDELNSLIGVVLAVGLTDRLAGELRRIQNELFHLGADLSFSEEEKGNLPIPLIESRHVQKLDALIADLNRIVGPLKNFILPGGAPSAANLHLARAVCRRVERDVAALSNQEEIGQFVLPYLNRLSDALFVMARFENNQRNGQETLWDSRA